MKSTIAAAVLLASSTFLVPLAHAGSGIEVTYQTTPEKLWQMVDFHQPSENIMPPVASSERSGEGVGATKINTLADGGAKIHLLLAYYEPSRHAFNYTIQEGPLPVKNYVGEVRVTDAGAGRATLSWQGTYEANGVPPEKADEILGGFFATIAQKIGETYPIVK